MDENTEKKEAAYPNGDEAKSPVGTFTLPCGYLDDDGKLHTDVLLREMTGEEEDILGSRGANVLARINQVMTNCIERLGPITDKARIGELVPVLPVADRNFLFIALRRVSLGDEFLMDVTCPGCEKKQKMSLNLADLAVKTMPEPSKRTFPVTLPSGKKLTWRLMTGVEEASLSKIRDATTKDLMTLAIAARLIEIDGKPVVFAPRVDARSKLSMDADTKKVFEFVKKLSLKDRDFMRTQFRDHEGGMESEVEFECDGCGKKFRSDFDPSQIGFFFPSGM